MVAPGMLANPEVRQWLNGIEPAWTILVFDSFFNALHGGKASRNVRSGGNERRTLFHFAT
jgi:hypothetical protein